MVYEKLSRRTTIEYNTTTLNKDSLIKGFNSIDISKKLVSQQYKSNKRRDIPLNIPKEYLEYIQLF